MAAVGAGRAWEEFASAGWASGAVHVRAAGGREVERVMSGAGEVAGVHSLPRALAWEMSSAAFDALTPFIR